MPHHLSHALVPFVWAGVALVMFWLRHQRRMAEIQAGRPAPDPFDALAHAHQRDVTQLRDRVRVLERIATDQARHDPAHRLVAQIDALKD